jgi:hypothetical protein
MRTVPPARSALGALDRATEWVNTEPLTAADLRGKVVAVQFCTYSCINWIRTLPYVRAWASAYRDDGLVIVGAHAPEFAFEREIGGVRRAMEEMGVEHPIVLDNEYAIWQAFGNRYWPALYLLDGRGRLRFRHFGEGAYRDTEEAIRDLVEAEGEPVRVEAAGIEAAADWSSLRSGETYLGHARAERRVAGAAEALALDQWTLAGDWNVGDEFAQLAASGGSISYRFQARDANLVLTPPPDAPVGFTVLLDGRAPGEAHGLDVDEEGRGTVSEPRLYQLVRQPGDVTQRTLEVAFWSPDVRAYVFTFG